MNGQNTPMKRQKLSSTLKKTDPTFCVCKKSTAGVKTPLS